MVYVKKNAHQFFSILLLTITITVFGPIELYFTNYDEFWFTYKDVLVVAGIQMIGCIAIFSIIGLLLKGRARDLYSGILFALSVALYVQGNYININYGVLDGDEIDWGAYPVYAAIDTIGWLFLVVGVIILWWYKRQILHKVQTAVSLYIIAVQIISLVILFFSTDILNLEKSDYYLSDEGIYDVSSENNIIIFVLDAFDDDYFQQILQEDYDKYLEVFSDFTHFRNTSVGGSRTKIGMPAIITGQPYPGKISYVEYIENSFDKDGLYTELQKQNYDVRLYTGSSFIPDDSLNLVNNQVATGYAVSSYVQLARKYLSLTLYKYTPHVLKRFFWIYSGDFDQYRDGNSARGYRIDDDAYFKGLTDGKLRVNIGKNIFRLFHLNGAHPPYTLNEYAEPVDGEETSAICQGKGALYIVENYIKQLKELGLYDSATIIVMADHGDIGLGEHGILLAKAKNNSSSFMESSAPVSYFDLHATLFQALGDEERDDTFFSFSEGPRERFFYKNLSESGNMKVVEYKIEGDINNDDAMKETGTIFEPLVDNNHGYQYGTMLSFGANNTAVKYIVNGVSSTDMENYSWTDGKECNFEFELEDEPKKNLMITLDVMTIYNGNGKQKVKFYVNGVESYEEVLTAGKRLQFVVPQSVVQKDKKLILRIELPDAVSPKSILGGEGNDVRMLGLAITGLCIDETEIETKKQYDNLEDFTQISFGNEGTAIKYLLNGWYEPEEGHTWSSGHAEILMKTSKICDYEITLHYGVHLPSGETTFYINNEPITVLNENETCVTIPIPMELLNEDGSQVLIFDTPNAVSPYNVGENEDRRVLGVCLYAMEVVPVTETVESR